MDLAWFSGYVRSTPYMYQFTPHTPIIFMGFVWFLKQRCFLNGINKLAFLKGDKSVLGAVGIKCKVKSSLCSIKHQAMKTYGEV
jgi:hypothetical protein